MSIFIQAVQLKAEGGLSCRTTDDAAHSAVVSVASNTPVPSKTQKIISLPSRGLFVVQKDVDAHNAGPMDDAVEASGRRPPNRRGEM